MAMSLLALVCGFVSLLGDNFRAAFGKRLVAHINYGGYAKIPSSDIFDPAHDKETELQIQSALDALGPSGARGGWEAALEILDAKRRQAEPFLALPDSVSVTILMGMSGNFTPVTSFTAMQRVSAIKEQYYATGRPDFLYQTVHAEVVRRLKESDSQSGYLGAGCLQKLFEARREPGRELGEAAREKAVLMYLEQVPEYRKFLGRDKNDYYTLPTGNSFESFAASMLKNAYGEFPR